jgi:glycosyltransferase involved in cell wall biosynthesis
VKIAHILSSFGIGGQERMAAELSRAQRAAGHTVIAISLAGDAHGPIGETLRATGVHTFVEKKGRGLDVTLPVRLAMRLRLERVDVVHTHNPHALVYGAPAGKLAGAATVHTKHGINPDRPRRLWLRRAAGALVDAYVVVTPALAAVAARNRECNPARLSVVPNGIDVTVFAPNPPARSEVRTALGIPAEARVVGTVGRLAPEKDQALLVRAMLPLLDPTRQLVIVGDGPERDALRELVRSTGCERFIHMVGARDDVARFLPAFDVFALPSLTEGLPLVLLEAMSTELVVVASAVGGIPDLIDHGTTGFLSAPGDCAGVSTQLAALMADAHLAEAVGRAARKQVRGHHSLERMAAGYEALYGSVRSAPRSARARAPARTSA